jgi:hypothetical protein
LILEGVPGGEDIVLKTGVDFAAARKDALQNWRGNRNDFHLMIGKQFSRAVEFFGGEVHDVFAPQHSEFRPRHANGAHGVKGRTKVRGKLVSDGGYAQFRCHRISDCTDTVAAAPDVTMEGMADPGRSTLMRFILWDYPRASWQYDVMVGLILAFIFLTPREFFRDQPRPKSIILVSADGNQASYWIEPEILGGAPAQEHPQRVEKLIQSQAGGKIWKVTRVEPVYDEEKEIRGYIAYTTR